MVTAFGITSLAQIMVTTYWGFYISPDVSIPLVERLVIDPIFFYGTMLLLVPFGFGIKSPNGINGANARPVPAAPISLRKSLRDRPSDFLVSASDIQLEYSTKWI